MFSKYVNDNNFYKIDKTSIYSIMAFLIGLLSANNILYMFYVGNTPIYVINVFCVICFVVMTIFAGGKVPIFNNIPFSLKLLLVYILLSFLTVLLLNSQYIYRWLVGIISLVLSLVVIYVVMRLTDYQKNIYAGIAVGIVINALFTIYAYILYLQGTMFTLSDYFPALNLPIQYSSNSFRSWGLFKEPGHMMRYLAIIFLPTYKCLFKKTSVKSVLFVIACFIIFAFTTSSSSLIFLLAIIVYGLLSLKNANWSKVAYILIAIAIFVVIYSVTGSNYLSPIINSVSLGLLDIFSSGSGNSTRVTGMKFALEIIKQYPIVGCGWNMLTSMFQENGFYGVNDALGSYSAGLTLVAEIGIGCAFYCYFVIKSSILFIKKKEDHENLAFGIALLLYLALFFATDYSIDGGSAVFLGLVLTRLLKNEKIDLYSAETRDLFL